MRKLFLLALSFVLFVNTRAQLVVILQSPSTGYTYKPQLWTMVLTNTGNTPLVLHIEATLNAASNSQQVLSGVTKTFTLAPGTKQITSDFLMPIQYNIASSSYSVDPNPFGLLPLGEFEACYHFFKHAGDVTTEIAEQCQDITVGPLSPPQLIYPYDQTGIEETNPQFSWLPPVPTQLFSNLQYDLTLVEVNANQSATDAILQNIPIYQGINLTANTLLYPISATALQYDHHYAWRIAAKSNGSVAGVSETWEFTLKHFGGLENTSPTAQPYVQLKKSPETAYAIFVGEIKFAYLNETSDTAWNVKLHDLSEPDRSERVLNLDSTALMRGQNLVKYSASGDSYFIHTHIYQLEVYNSRNEVWSVRFEYRKPTEPNN